VTRVFCALALVALLAGCGSNGDEPDAGAGGGVEKCVARFVERIQGMDRSEAEGYARRTYCEPLSKRGWVHEDGTLSIDFVRKGFAHECVAPRAGEPAQTIPCDETSDLVLDCGPLHLIRKAEVQEYLEERQRKGDVQCDDTTPLNELGAE
jgi:hypothetical protein